jgi:hypothetical protein
MPLPLMVLLVVFAVTVVAGVTAYAIDKIVTRQQPRRARR